MAPFISNEPYVHTFKRNGNEKFIILACDGVWDDCKDLEAAKIVDEVLKEEKSNEIAMKASTRLRDYALAVGSRDNITSMVIIF